VFRLISFFEENFNRIPPITMSWLLLFPCFVPSLLDKHGNDCVWLLKHTIGVLFVGPKGIAHKTRAIHVTWHQRLSAASIVIVNTRTDNHRVCLIELDVDVLIRFWFRQMQLGGIRDFWVCFRKFLDGLISPKSYSFPVLTACLILYWGSFYPVEQTIKRALLAINVRFL
jgi:hypothetical protein